jgi:hypothetical protein
MIAAAKTRHGASLREATEHVLDVRVEGRILTDRPTKAIDCISSERRAALLRTGRTE